MFGSFAKRLWSPDHPWGPTMEEREKEYELIAREWGKPVFIAEITPRGFFLGQASGNVWTDWYEALFDHIEEHPDMIKAISYINTDWDAEPMWEPTVLTR